MASQHVSVYFDDSTISVLVSRGREPQKWSTVPLEAGLVREGVVQDQAALAAKLKDIWRSLGIVRRRVTFGISGINCLYQLLLLPDLPENLRGEAISREAAHSLGIPLEGVYLSWQVLSVEHGQMKVFLAVIPRDKVDSLVGAMRLAGLRPTVMDIRPLCLARVSPEPRAIIVDTCQDAFDIVVLGDGIPEVVRSLYVAPDTPAGERIALLRSELERAVSFFNAAHMDKPIDLSVPILVSGDLAADEGAQASLAGPRERPVRDMGSPLVEKEGFAPLQYMTCIGLALKEILVGETGAVAYSVVNFNALPDVYQVRRRPLAEVLWVPTLLVGVVLIGMGVWGIIYLKGQNSDLADGLAETNLRTQNQGLRAADITALTGLVDQVEKPQGDYESLLNSLDEGRAVVVEHLALVVDAASSNGVTLGSVNLGEANKVKTVSVDGSAASEAEVFKFAWALENSERFMSVNLLSITATDTGTAFTMSLTPAS
jgi:type IV pilus assembly protein PilM